jgi:hypothetical protein
MDIWLITLLAMWINPILGFFLIRFLKKRTKHIRWVLIFFASITIVEILSIITKISFKSTTADFIFTSVFYLGVCSSIWILIFNKKVNHKSHRDNPCNTNIWIELLIEHNWSTWSWFCTK